MVAKARIRSARPSDAEGISGVLRAAFAGPEGAVIDTLVNDLLADPAAEPLVSLVAEVDNRIVGHILFTCIRLEDTPGPARANILAPLAVTPDHQRQGIGGLLIEAGLKQSKEDGTDLVFVLGHPEYYPRHGFNPAGAQGFEAPYPIPARNADAWMVRELSPGVAAAASGRVICAGPLMDPKHWRE